MSVTVWLVQEIAELRDQLRDLMFYLEAKQTLATTTEATQQEIQAGQIIVQSPTTSGQGGKKSRKKTRWQWCHCEASGMEAMLIFYLNAIIACFFEYPIRRHDNWSSSVWLFRLTGLCVLACLQASLANCFHLDSLLCNFWLHKTVSDGPSSFESASIVQRFIVS